MANFRPGDRSDAGAFFISAQAPLGRDFMLREFLRAKVRKARRRGISHDDAVGSPTSVCELLTLS
jgi:hypothetical protein